MAISDLINIVLSILSLVLAATSIVIVVLTIRQNNKMIRNSTRAYVAVYGSYTYYSSPQFYLVIKNFGTSGAVIMSLECSIDLSKYSYLEKLSPFGNIENTTIAPNQNYICVLDIKALDRDSIDKFSITITYKSGKDVYKETYPINYLFTKHNVIVTSANKGNELRDISYVLQDIGKKQL